METADVRRRVKEALERVKRQHAERRARNAEAGAAYETFLQRSAIPVFHQVAGALKAEGYLFTVNTPAGSVRLVSDRSADDYVDLRLDTSLPMPQVTIETQRLRGRELRKEERALKAGTLVEHLTEQDVLDSVIEVLPVLIEK